VIWGAQPITPQPNPTQPSPAQPMTTSPLPPPPAARDVDMGPHPSPAQRNRGVAHPRPPARPRMGWAVATDDHAGAGGSVSRKRTLIHYYAFLYPFVYNTCKTMAVHLLRDPSVGDRRRLWIQLSTFTLRVQHRIGTPRREEELVPCSITSTTPQTVTIRFRKLGCQKTFSWRATRSVWIMVGIPTPSHSYYISIASLGVIPPHHLCVQSVEPNTATTLKKAVPSATRDIIEAN
jgi:hypothetical protein